MTSRRIENFLHRSNWNSMEKEPLTKERVFDNIEVQGILNKPERGVFQEKKIQRKCDGMIRVSEYIDVNYGSLELFEEEINLDD